MIAAINIPIITQYNIIPINSSEGILLYFYYEGKENIHFRVIDKTQILLLLLHYKSHNAGKSRLSEHSKKHLTNL